MQGRHALVTGGGTGIGLACARALTETGAVVTVLGRREAALRNAVAAGAAADWVVADLTAGLPPLPAATILINAAGAAESAPFGRDDDALWRRMLELNLFGAVGITRAMLPHMLAGGWGRVVNVASTAALKGYAYVTAYASAKHALLGFTRALAMEVATRGVTVNAVCPGFTETPLLAESVARIVARTGRDADDTRAELARHNPQGRLVQAAEVAAAVAFLCGDAAGAVTGTALPVAGGEIG